MTMRAGIYLQLAHLIVLSCRALIPDTRNQEIFCFRSKSELGRTQCSFLRRPSAVASVLFYWTIWTAEHRIEECSLSGDPALIQNYMLVCHELGTSDLHKMSSLSFNITLLLEPGSPCKFRPIAFGNLMRHRYLDRGYQVDSSGSRMRQKRAWIFPGTLWCGHGSRAGDYEQLGMFERVDSCCREHDHCDHIIRPFTVNFGVFNPMPFTISHCACDYRFKQCLLDINDTVSNMVGYTFFNILKLHCFDLIQKKRCTKINWIGMCTSDKVAPFAILKHTTMYNATNSNASIPEPPDHKGKPAANTRPKIIKHKQRKKSKYQKSYVPDVAAEHTFLLSEIIGQPYGKPKTISPTSTTAQPNCLMSCNTTFFHQKYKLIDQSTPFPAAATSTAQVHTTSMASTKQIATASKKIGPNKRKYNNQWPTTTVQTKFIKRCKPLISKLNCDPPRGDHFQSKQQRGMDGKQDNASLHGTVSTNFLTLSLARKLPKTNRLFESMSQLKKEANFPNRKKTSNSISSTSHPQNIITSEMKDKSTEATKLPEIWNNTNSAYETFKPAAICDVTRHLDDCKYRIRPMEKLYGHHNTETTTIYHCNCIHRLTEHFKQLESIALLQNLLWKFVSMSCIEIPNTKECSNNARCSAILCKATELESSLIKLESHVTVKNRKISTNKRVSNQLYKHCHRILRSRSQKHVKHSA